MPSMSGNAWLTVNGTNLLEHYQIGLLHLFLLHMTFLIYSTVDKHNKAEKHHGKQKPKNKGIIIDNYRVTIILFSVAHSNHQRSYVYIYVDAKKIFCETGGSHPRSNLINWRGDL